MGAIFPIGDSQALAKGLIAVIKAGKANFKNKLDFSRYQPDDIAQAYEELFQDIRQTH